MISDRDMQWMNTVAERLELAKKKLLQAQCDSNVMLYGFLGIVSIAGPVGVTLAQLPEDGQPGPGHWDQVGYAWVAGLILFLVVCLWARSEMRREDAMRAEVESLERLCALEQLYEKERG